MCFNWPVSGVPDADGAIVAGGGEQLAVGAERQAEDGIGVAVERERLAGEPRPVERIDSKLGRLARRAAGDGEPIAETASAEIGPVLDRLLAERFTVCASMNTTRP